MSSKSQIAIVGRPKYTKNYERFLLAGGFEPIVTLNPREAISCAGLILPGGGDITPAFFGEHNKGSRNIDTELDILQFQTLELFLRHELPVIGICKGMQLINIAFGGTIAQDMCDVPLHLSPQGDLYHDTYITPGTFLASLYGETAWVNSAHHQCIQKVGSGLSVIQTCILDNCPEAIVHTEFPILGLQWHPERLDKKHSTLSGEAILSFLQTALSFESCQAQTNHE